MPTIDGDFKKQGGRVAGARGTPDMKKGYSADMQCGMKRHVLYQVACAFVPIGTVQTVA